MMANEWWGVFVSIGGFPKLELGSCSRQQGVLLQYRGSPLRGLQVPPYLKFKRSDLRVDAWKAHLALPLHLRNRAGFIRWL